MAKTSRSKLSVFLVEDDENTIRTISLVLKNEGFEVLVAKDGREALEVLGKNEIEPDLILLDLVLPYIDGFEVLKFLQQKGSKVPEVVLSNLGQDATIEKALGLGARDFLVKSRLSLSMILAKVKSYLK